MSRYHRLGSIVIFVLAAANPAGAADTCPRTLGSPAVFPEPWPQAATWYGSEGLAVILTPGGTLSTTKPGASLAAKYFWYSRGLASGGEIEGYQPGSESEFTGKVERLDDGPNDAVMSEPTNAGGASLGAWTILTGVHFPSPGCWKITGAFRGQTLSFVVETYDDSRTDNIP